MKACLLATCALALCSSAHANLILNGSFESPVLTPGTLGIYAAGTTFTGWTITNSEVIIIPSSYVDGGQYPAAQGIQSLDLTGYGNRGPGGVKQSAATTPFQTYRLAFSVGDFNYGGNVASVGLYVDNALVGTYVNADGTATNSEVWKRFNYDFQAAGPSTSVEFRNANTSPSYYLAGLDDVVLDRVGPSAVPEPGSIALCLTGGIALAIFRKRT